MLTIGNNNRPIYLFLCCI